MSSLHIKVFPFFKVYCRQSHTDLFVYEACYRKSYRIFFGGGGVIFWFFLLGFSFFGFSLKACHNLSNVLRHTHCFLLKTNNGTKYRPGGGTDWLDIALL